MWDCPGCCSVCLGLHSSNPIRPAHRHLQFFLSSEESLFRISRSMVRNPRAFPTQLHLGGAISMYNRLGKVPHKVILTIPMRYSREHFRNHIHKRTLFVRHPRSLGLAQPFSPRAGFLYHLLDLRFSTRQQRHGKPNSPRTQFTNHVESLMALFRLQPINRENQINPIANMVVRFRSMLQGLLCWNVSHKTHLDSG